MDETFVNITAAGDYAAVEAFQRKRFFMEHTPWVPAGFESRPQRILIVGHSHHVGSPDDDYEGFTIDCVEMAKQGEMQKYPFFARQPAYLRLDRASYYDQIALVNFVPAALLDRYGEPGPDLIVQGQDRIKQLVALLKPTHIFVLSSRLHFGPHLPMCLEQERNGTIPTIDLSFGPIQFGTYLNGDFKSICCRLPHPQAATTAWMQESFEAVLKL